MKALEHPGKNLRYLTVYPDDYDPQEPYPRIIMLHGFGASMYDLAGLAPFISPSGYLFVCPNGPLTLHLGPGMTGHAWTPIGNSASPQDIRYAEETLESFFNEVVEKHRAHPGQALLLGFSQGGAMTYRCGLPRPDRFAGLVALSAVLPDLQELERRLPAQRAQALFIAHGLYDPLVPIEQARKARDWLASAGYAPSYHEYPMAHEVAPQALKELASWIHQVLPPKVPAGASGSNTLTSDEKSAL